MKSLIVGNWKLYVNTLSDAKKLLKGIEKGFPRGIKSEVVVCPQISLAPLLREHYGGKRIGFGTQDVFFESEGAHTGQTSTKSLVSGGMKYVIVGHAERRMLGDTDEIVSKKAAAAIKEKIHPIICVGEPERDTEGGHFSYLANNVINSLARLEPTDATKFTIAYDPSWAIGAVSAPDPRVVREAIMFVRKTIADIWGRDRALKVRIIYGGSVDAESAAAFASHGGVQGLLVGRASVNAGSFTEIIRAFS